MWNAKLKGSQSLRTHKNLAGQSKCVTVGDVGGDRAFCDHGTETVHKGRKTED